MALPSLSSAFCLVVWAAGFLVVEGLFEEAPDGGLPQSCGWNAPNQDSHAAFLTTALVTRGATSLFVVEGGGCPTH